MARKQITVTIDAKNRDNGKEFIITEASTDQTESWAIRAILAAMNAGAEIPQEVADAGLAGIVQMGINGLALIPYEKAKPLLDEMMDCVQYKVKNGITRPLGLDGDIEEVSTKMRLRKEIIALHTSFFIEENQFNGDTDPRQ